MLSNGLMIDSSDKTSCITHCVMYCFISTSRCLYVIMVRSIRYFASSPSFVCLYLSFWLRLATSFCSINFVKPLGAIESRATSVAFHGE